VVQEAFCGLYRRWDGLADPSRALAYVRSSVLNGCRTVLRRRQTSAIEPSYQPSEISAEAAALSIEERRDVMRALRRLPSRQREALVLRFYLDEPEARGGPPDGHPRGNCPFDHTPCAHRARPPAGRTLAIDEEQPEPQGAQYHVQVRLLDTAAPGTRLWSSRVALRVSGGLSNAMITPDGTRIVIPVVTKTAREFAEYSVGTGKLVAGLGLRHYPHANYGGFPILFWSSPSGRTLVAHDIAPHGRLLAGNGEPARRVLGVATGDRFTPLPGPGSLAVW
jgi:RNA polymerase sigma factor (sigma-70 family)